MLRHRRDAAVVAAADASGPTEAARLESAVSSWDSVQAYLADAL